jgi:parallel beta-helix repeat protein
MKSDKERFIVAILLVALTMMMVLPDWARAVPAPSTIIVPVNYPTISAAIANAAAGDTIIVQSGTYYENPIINKPLTLKGENSANTVVVGTGTPNATGKAYAVGPSVFTVTADNVKISGFTITSFNYAAQPQFPNGIVIEANNCAVTDNNIVNTFTGVFFSGQSSNVVDNNNITGSHENGVITYGGFNNTISTNNIASSVAKDGIAIEGYSYNVTGNNISQSPYGLGLSSTYSVVFKNNITESSVSGIWLTGSNDIISANYVSNNTYGIYSVPTFGLSSNNTIFHNDLIDNTQNAASNTVYNIQTWDNGYPQGGNYWSDYSTVYPNATEKGNSGIMNTQYTICANNTDNYPLMKPFDISNAGACPSENIPPARSSDVAGSWSFQSVEPDGVTPDATGNNPAVFGSVVSNISYVPEKVAGKYGSALYFNGLAYAYVPPSPSIQTPSDLTIEAWVYLNQYKNDTYNNIVIEAVTTSAALLPNRTVGFAINGYVVNGSSSPELGALRGYVTTDTGGFNEIDTAQPLSLNTWYHVVFTRSTQTGMHIYVNGVEQNVTVFAGVQNPAGSIVPATVIYLGHDSISTQEDVQILSVAAPPTSTPIWQQWWFWTPVAAAFAILVGIIYYVRKTGLKRNTAMSKSSHMLNSAHWASWD